MENSEFASAMMDIKGVAKLLRCSTKSVERMVASKRLPPPVKLGTLSRWPIKALETWIEGGCAPVENRSKRCGARLIGR